MRCNRTQRNFIISVVAVVSGTCMRIANVSLCITSVPITLSLLRSTDPVLEFGIRIILSLEITQYWTFEVVDLS